MKIKYSNFTMELLIGWPFFLFGIFATMLVLRKTILAFEMEHIWAFGVTFSMAFVGWACIHDSYCLVSEKGVDCFEASIFTYNQTFIQRENIDKIELKDEVIINGKAFQCKKIILHSKDGFEFEMKQAGKPEQQTLLHKKICNILEL